jgi:hypothetical protein
MDIGALPADIQTEVKALTAAVTGVKALIADAKAKASLTVDVAAVEALLAPVEAAVSGAEKLATDL